MNILYLRVPQETQHETFKFVKSPKGKINLRGPIAQNKKKIFIIPSLVIKICTHL